MQTNQTKFKPLTKEELISILGITIKKDEENKLITFLCGISAFTENSQFNVSFNAPSSTGKTYIPTEIANLFPKEDVLEIGYCSPTAFFHEAGIFNNDKGGFELDLSRKIIIFLDQPHTILLERLRPILSHDKKEINSKITDKSSKNGLKTKNVFIKGFPAVIFCSAGMKIDEQESTRFLLLSPDINQEKIRQSIWEKISKETDAEAYRNSLENNPDRKLLKERILAIKNENVEEIKIGNPKLLERMFMENRHVLKPRHQRDIGRLIAIAKAFALLNLWYRERDNNAIIASDEDIIEAFEIWGKMSESQEYNLSPYIFNFYKEIILSAWRQKNSNPNIKSKIGVSRQEIQSKYFEINNAMLPSWKLRQDILPLLEASGLITEEQDTSDKRITLISPISSNLNN